MARSKARISKNKGAEKIMGKRNLPDNTIPFDFPCELGYHCPVCQYPTISGGLSGHFDERLHWSEYEGFIWCSICNKDYPSCFCYNEKSDIPGYVYRNNPKCKTYIDLAIKTFLTTVEYARRPVAGAEEEKREILNYLQDIMSSFVNYKTEWNSPKCQKLRALIVSGGGKANEEEE